MRFITHDFYSNFSAFVGSKDDEMTKELLLNEIASIMTFPSGRRKLVKTLRLSDIEVPKRVKDTQLAGIIIDNLTKKDFVEGLSIMITKRHLKNFKTNWSNQDGDGFFSELFGGGGGGDTGGTGGGEGGGGANAAGAIAAAIGSIFGFAKATQERKGQKDAHKQQLMQKVIDIKAAREARAGRKWVAPTVIIGSLAAITLVVYLIKRKKSAKAVSS